MTKASAFSGAVGGFPTPTSPLIEAPVKRDTGSIQQLMFSGAAPVKVGEFTVYSDQEVGHLILQELEIFSDTNGNGIRDGQEEVEVNYTLRVFISRDVSKLEKAFDKHTPGENDVCLFLEDNSGDSFSGTTAWRAYGSVGMIVVGDHIRDQLSDWFDRPSGSGYEHFKALEQQFGFSVDYSRRQLKRLVEDGRVQSSSRQFAIGLYQFFNGFTVLAAPVNRAIGSFITGATSTIRSYVQFQPHHWDPEAIRPDEVEAPFSPALVPVSYETLDYYAAGGEGAASEVVGQLASALREWSGMHARVFRKLSGRGSRGLVIPKYLKDFLKTCQGYISELSEWAVDSVKQMVAAFAGLGRRWVNAVNAFYCGLWNGLVESVLGLVDLVGYLFLGIGAVGDAIGNAQTLIPKAMETLDELLQTIQTIDYGGLLQSVFEMASSGLSQLNPWAFTQSISLEKVAYFFGQVVGFIVEIVASIFYSGGVDGIRAAATKFTNLFGSLGKGMVGLLRDGIQSLFGTVASGLEGMLAMLGKVIEFLKDARLGLEALVDWLMDGMVKLARLSDDAMRAVIRKFGFSKQELKALDDLGLTLTNYSGDACQACMARL